MNRPLFHRLSGISSRYISSTLGPISQKISTTPNREIETTTINANAYFKYEPLEDSETLEGYCPGGYHPLSIGNYLYGRYCIVHKLGYGAYSTLWLAKDEKLDKYVAVKVTIADDKSNEGNILRHLKSRDAGSNHPGLANIPSLLDEFNINGPNGEHRCTVTQPASMSLSDAREASNNGPFRLPVARAIAAQLIQAVAFLHSQGTVHGDIHMGNILLHLPKMLDSLSQDELYAQYGPPDYEPVVRLDNQPLPIGVPTHAITPIWLGERSDRVSLAEANVLLIDYGESFQPSIHTRHHTNIPIHLAPPELHFPSAKNPLSFPIDIWSLACTIYNIIGVRPLFESFARDSTWMIKEHVTALGPLPFEWWQKWDARLKWFNEDGTRKCEYELGSPWDERFEKFVQKPRRRDGGREVVGNEERDDLFKMLKGMLAYRPEERLTGSQVMKSSWMEKWAGPELERMKATAGGERWPK